MRVWFDESTVASGDQISVEAESALSTLPGAVFLLTPISIQRPFIRKVELDRAGKRKNRDSSFRLVFVLCDVSAQDAEDVVRAHAKIDLRSVRYERLSLKDLEPQKSQVATPRDPGRLQSRQPDAVSLQANASRADRIGVVCDRISEPFVGDICKEIVRSGRKFCRLGLYTYGDEGPLSGEDLSLDWRIYFHNRTPTVPDWDQRLRPALEPLVRLLKKNEIQSLHVCSRAHLSAGIAVGYAFRSVRGIAIRVKHRHEYWSFDEDSAAISDVQVTAMGADGPFDSTDYSVEVSISRDVSPAVDELIAEGILRARRRKRLTMRSGISRMSVRDEEHANAIAASVVRAIMDIREDQPNARSHLFLAAPFAVAVFIGAMLNKCGPAQLYEFDSRTGKYQASCVIGDE